MIDRATTLLLNAQNPDGGWGVTAGKGSNTEATSLAIMALELRKHDRETGRLRSGISWLTQRQSPDGSWPLSDRSKVPSWSTAMALLALYRWPEYQARVLGAAKWVLDQEGRKPGWLSKVLFKLSGQNTPVRLNVDLIGWPWISGTFSWVEPTSYSLIALKKVRSKLAGSNVSERIQQGELMIYDRMCHGGGWNYGNSVVFEENLLPYPDTTAVALIALQDHRETAANRQSLQALKAMLKDVQSGLALSWGIICLSLYGEDTSEWKELLVKSFERTQFLGETKIVALAILAMGDGAKVFKA